MAVSLTDVVTYKRLVTAGNDEIWYEDIDVSAGSMIELTDANGDIDTTDQLMMFELEQKVFIVNGENLKVADFMNTELDLGAGNELTDPPAKGDILSQATSLASMIVDHVDSTNRYIRGYVTTGTFNTTNTVSSNDETATMNPSTFTPAVVTSGPLWYDWTAFPDVNLSDGSGTKSYGSLPGEAYIGCNYRGRPVISGNTQDPHQWYMGRQLHPWDFAYVANDAQTPVLGNSTDAGKIGDIVRALIPYKDDYLIFGCATSMWYCRGDPAEGGTIDDFDRTVGIYGPFAWCIDGDGTLYFWGTGGIYSSKIQGGIITKPQLLTGLHLPNIIGDEGADPSTHRICMGYDRRRLGIVISITKVSDGTNSNYWYDLRTEGFFPETYPEECAAYSLFNYQANNADYSDLLIGGKDGYIRKFDDTAKDDDIGDSDEAIDSYCTVIQKMSEEDDKEGKLMKLIGTTAGGASSGGFSDTDSVDYELHVANDAETCLEDIVDGATAHTTGSWSGSGRQTPLRTKVRGAFLGIKLYNDTASETWAMEDLTAEIKQVGKIR